MSEAQEHFRWLLTATYRAKNGPIIREGAPELWAYAETLLADAVGRGWLAEQ